MAIPSRTRPVPNRSHLVTETAQELKPDGSLLINLLPILVCTHIHTLTALVMTMRVWYDPPVSGTSYTT